ncbi:MAG: hypothetical protein CMM02_17640 [Rhodopirellula sp.]|nr:hypothetical protein [Rhodopirellula sp.]
MKPVPIVVIVSLSVVLTAFTTLQFATISRMHRSDHEIVQQELDSQFGNLVTFEWDDQSNQILGVYIDAQCLDSRSTFETLAKLKDLRVLSIRHGQFQDTDLEPLSSLSKLTSVELQSLHFTGAGLEHLTGSKGITSLKLNNNPAWAAEESKRLEELPLLEEIQLACTATTDESIKAFTNHQSLHTLVLDNTHVTFAGLKSISENSNLRHLSLRSCLLGSLHPDALSQLTTKLPFSLNLADSDVTDEALINIQSLNVVHLNLSGTQISDQGLTYLSGHAYCQSLDLSYTQCSSNGLTDVVTSLPLQSLILRGIKLNEDALEAFGQCTQLTILNLANTNVQDQWLAALGNAKELEYLILYRTEVTGITLGELTNLSYLDLSFCPVDSKAIEQLDLLTNLASLQLMGLNLSHQAVKYFTKTNITHLNLSNSSITNRDLHTLSMMPALKELFVRNCDISVNDFEMFQSRNTNCVIYWQAYGRDSTYAKPEAMQAMTNRP